MFIQRGATVKMENINVQKLNKIGYIILSKDRACQLDLLLQSIDKNMPELISPTVLYRSSSANFDAGYNVVKRRKFACNPVFVIMLRKTTAYLLLPFLLSAFIKLFK